MTAKIDVLDSSAWFHYLARTGAGQVVRRRLRGGPSTSVITPTIVLAEVVGKLRRVGRTPRPFLEAAARYTTVEPLGQAAAEFGGEIYGRLKPQKPGLSLVDALVLAIARGRGGSLWTTDQDLVGEEGVHALRPGR